jgi:4-amino-4-deoxy-L-arabinose transferase-like glycosyltransferase
MTAAGIAQLVQVLPTLPISLPEGWGLPARDAARLATALYLLILFGFTVLLGRAAWVRHGQSQGQGAIALLVLMGTPGLLYTAHALSPDIALAAGVAMGLYGLVIAPRRLFWGGIWLGTGFGLAFLSKGLLGPGILAATALLLPLFRDWRSARYLRALLVALVAALPWLVIWPLLLFLRDPALFEIWFWENGLGRFAEQPLISGALAAPASGEFWARSALWVTFPASLLAILTLLVGFWDAVRSAGVRVALIASLIGWVMLVYAAEASELDALPLLAPMAVIGVGCISRLPRLVVGPFYLLIALVFAVAAAVLWGLWVYHMYAGQPFQHPLLAQYLPMDFDFVWQPVAYVAAALVTVLWLWVAMRFRPPRSAALLAWPVGVVMLWGLVSLLHLPWVDAAVTEHVASGETQAAPSTAPEPSEPSGAGG